MNNKIIFHLLDLQLFADGTGAAGGDTGAGGATGADATAAVSQQKGVKTNPLADVVYGKTAEAKDTAQTADVQESSTKEADTVPAVDRNAEFEKLIKGDYKDLYDAKVQDIVTKRLKGSKETVDKYNALAPTIEMLAKKYGVDPSDIPALNKAIEEDDSYYEEEALEKGVTVEHLKFQRKLEKENAELKRQMQEQEARENGAKLYARWMDEAKSAKAVYPGFDLKAEMQNQQFVDLLRANVDVRTAYEVIHKDEIIPAAMQFTAQAVEKKLTNNIIAGGRRPAENGTSSQSAARTKSDVSQLTKDDIAEISRRVARGERITFG